MSEDFYGVSAPDLWDMSVQNQNAKRDGELDGMKAAGIDWVRVEIGWPRWSRSPPPEQRMRTSGVQVIG